LALLATSLVFLDRPVDLLEPADLAHALDELRNLRPEAGLDLAQRDPARRTEEYRRHLGGRSDLERAQDPERTHGMPQYADVRLVATAEPVADELHRGRDLGIGGAGRRPIRRGSARKFRIGHMGRLHGSI